MKIDNHHDFADKLYDVSSAIVHGTGYLAKEVGKGLAGMALESAGEVYRNAANALGADLEKGELHTP